jgi:hypothetical protein
MVHAGNYADYQLAVQGGKAAEYPLGVPILKPRVWINVPSNFDTFKDAYTTLFGLMVPVRPHQPCCHVRRYASHAAPTSAARGMGRSRGGNRAFDSLYLAACFR